MSTAAIDAALEQAFQRRARSLRSALLQLIHTAGAGHTGGGLSCIDILNVLYNGVLRVAPDTVTDPDRDRYIQSKGHAVEALYVVLAERGFFPRADLQTLCRYQSPFIGHPTRKVPGIEHNTGALGHGLSLAAGSALSARLDRRAFRAFVLLGDGELAEGSNWEAALFAAHHRLDNLVAIVDFNKLQITGPVAEVCALEPLAAKWLAFGWGVRECSGHDFGALWSHLHHIPFQPGRPSLLIAHTLKGKGVSFMESNGQWHHKVPDSRELARALAELAPTAA